MQEKPLNQKYASKLVRIYNVSSVLLTQSPENISLCISQSLALLQCDYFGQLFLKKVEKKTKNKTKQ